jgi:hypothetical protein
VNSVTLFEKLSSGEADFVYPATSFFPCIDSAFGLSPLVGIRRKYRFLDKDFVLNSYGGIIVVKTNSSVQSVHDLVGKVIEGSNILLVQFQWQVFQDYGLSFMQDPEQIRFPPSNRDQAQVLWDVLDGGVDAGLVRDILILDPQFAHRRAELRILPFSKQFSTDSGQQWPFQVVHSIVLAIDISWCFAIIICPSTSTNNRIGGPEPRTQSQGRFEIANFFVPDRNRCF